jgi:hypothetical protein
MQPSNASVRGAPCFMGDPGQCTRVSLEACTLGPGGGAGIVRQAVIECEGQSDPNPPYEVETFNVDVPVEKGQDLAIKARRTSMLRCSSGGPNQLLFQPARRSGGPFAGVDGTDGCRLVLQAACE